MWSRRLAVGAIVAQLACLAGWVLQLPPRLNQRDQENAGLLPGGNEMSNAFNVNDTST